MYGYCIVLTDDATGHLPLPEIRGFEEAAGHVLGADDRVCGDVVGGQD